MENEQLVQADILIPRGRRIAELMDERGKAYSIQAMANRLGMNRETFRYMISGKREVYDIELRQVADIFQIPFERLSQEDIRKKKQELEYILENSIAPEEMHVTYAKELVKVSIGYSEPCIANILLGRIYYELKRYNEAHKAWLDAHPYAEKVREKFGDPELLYNVITYINVSCAIRKDYSGVSSFFLEAANVLEKVVDTKPQWAAYNSYYLAKVYEKFLDFSAARKSYYDSIHFSEISKHLGLIGRFKLNTANFEYRMLRYQVADALYRESLELLISANDTFGKLLCVKEYVKCLLKQGDYPKAEQLIETSITEVVASEVAEIRSFEPHFYLLLARSKNDPQLALNVLESADLDIEIRRIACNFLIDHYDKADVAEEVLKYRRIYNDLAGISYDVLDEEVL